MKTAFPGRADLSSVRRIGNDQSARWGHTRPTHSRGNRDMGTPDLSGSLRFGSARGRMNPALLGRDGSWSQGAIPESWGLSMRLFGETCPGAGLTGLARPRGPDRGGRPRCPDGLCLESDPTCPSASLSLVGSADCQSAVSPTGSRLAVGRGAPGRVRCAIRSMPCCDTAESHSALPARRVSAPGTRARRLPAGDWPCRCRIMRRQDGVCQPEPLTRSFPPTTRKRQTRKAG